MRQGAGKRDRTSDQSTPVVTNCLAVVRSFGLFREHTESTAQDKILDLGAQVKRWSVATPNRWYPFEFHIRLPFVTWLPRHGYLELSRLVFYSSAAGKYIGRGRYISPLRLLGAGEVLSR